MRVSFRLEHRRERTDYRAAMKADFDADVLLIDFATLPVPSTDPLHVSDAEMRAEAFELFMNQRMGDYDAMFAERHGLFESAMVVVQAGTIEDEYLLLPRTVAFWARLRYVYFDMGDLPIATLRKEVSGAIQTEILGLSEQQRHEDLRAEVSDIVTRVTRRRVPPDGLLPPPSILQARKDEDDKPPAQNSLSTRLPSNTADTVESLQHFPVSTATDLSFHGGES